MDLHDQRLDNYIFFYLFFPYRQDIKELKEELSEERSKRTILQVSGNAAKEESSLTPGSCCCYQVVCLFQEEVHSLRMKP